jgi:hypothetical protein
MGKEDNLTPFQKGSNPNPNGRPKGSLNRSTIAKKWLEVTESVKNPITGENERLSQEDIMTLAVLKKARNGDVNAYKELLNNGYGLPTQKLDIKQEKPIFNGLNLDVNEDNNDS